MEGRGGRQRQPQQRHSSLPASLHRLLVLGSPSPPGTPTPETQNQDDREATPAPQTQRNEPGPSRYRLQGGPEPVHPATAGPGQPLPSFVLTPAVFAGLGGFTEPLPPNRRSVSHSQISHTVAAREPAIAGALPLPVPALEPPPYPPQQIISTDPVYYASSSARTLRPALPPGPRLRPISWSEESVAAGPHPPLPAARLGSPDRSAFAPPQTYYPQPTRIPLGVAPPSPPVAGPSRLPASEEPQTGERKRKARSKKAEDVLPLKGSNFATGEAPSTARRRQDISASRRGRGNRAASTTAIPARGRGESSSQRTARSLSRRRSEAGPHSPKRQSKSGRGSPASSTEEYRLAVGPTAYSVTTLSPLRATPILPPAPELGPTAGTRLPHLPAAVPAAGPSRSRRREEESGEGMEVDVQVKRGESDAEGEGEGGGPGPAPSRSSSTAGRKRRRRGQQTSQPQESTPPSASSSEPPQAPKAKKTQIACHFCRARKLRCDGQRPSCANCSKRGHPCTYEQQPKRRGPGKAPRGSTRRRRQPPEGASVADAMRTTEAVSGGTRASTATASVAVARASAPAPEAAGPSNAEAALGQDATSPPSARARRAQAAASPISLPFPSTSSLISAPAPAAQSAVQASLSLATQPAFDPQLRGPVPVYPGLAYRSPSATSSSYSAGHASSSRLHPYTLGRGMTRSVASDSVRSRASNTSNVSSAPSVPESEDGSVAAPDEFDPTDFVDYERFYRSQGHSHPPSSRPGPGHGGAEDGSQ